MTQYFHHRKSAASVLGAAMTMALGIASAAASSITVPPSGTLTGFGDSGTQYRGQTFTALSALAEELTVYVGPTSDGLDFRLLVTELDTTSGVRPTTVLFESNTLHVPVFPIQAEPFAYTVNLGGLALAPGEQYAWILDSFVVSDGLHSTSSTGIDLLAAYADGQEIFLDLGPFPSGTRAEHFAMDWGTGPGNDLAFLLTFEPSAISLPGSFPLLATGLAVMLAFRLARSGSSNEKQSGTPADTLAFT